MDGGLALCWLDTGYLEESKSGYCPQGAYIHGRFQEVNVQLQCRGLNAKMQKNTKDSGTREGRTPS